MKILAVDDDEIILQLMKSIFTSSGYTDVTFAESAEQAAEIISKARSPFDCMFIDMRMPGATGEELCSWIRKLPQYEETPLLMVTSLSRKDDIDLAFAAGASDYINKPIVLSDFIDRVEKIRRQVDKKNNLKVSTLNENKDTIEPNRIDFYQPRWLGGINCEIEIDALEKYIFQLSKSGSLVMEAFSFVIKDASKLHSSCKSNDFLYILKSVGTAISQCIPAPQFFLSYAGYGAFTGVAQITENPKISWEQTEASVQQILIDIEVFSTSRDAVRVVPYMSDPQKLGKSNGQSAVDVLYRAIGDAEYRCNSSVKLV